MFKVNLFHCRKTPQCDHRVKEYISNILYIHITSNFFSFFFFAYTLVEERESQLGLYAYVKFMYSSRK